MTFITFENDVSLNQIKISKAHARNEFSLSHARYTQNSIFGLLIWSLKNSADVINYSKHIKNGHLRNQPLVYF